jgi:hypothetical protein
MPRCFSSSVFVRLDRRRWQRVATELRVTGSVHLTHSACTNSRENSKGPKWGRTEAIGPCLPTGVR